MEEEITVEGDGVPIRHISRGYFPFSPELEHNNSDGGPILLPPIELQRDGILVYEWRRRALLPD
jgi:hypothetical protein